MTLELVIRSPFRFGALIAVLGTCDTYFVRFAGQYEISRTSVDRLGAVLLPMLWTFVGVFARTADVPQSAGGAVAGIAHKRVWLGISIAAAQLLAFNLLVDWVSGGFVRSPHPHGYLGIPGQFVDAIAGNVMVITIAFGWCYLPLLVLNPDLPWTLVRRLSRDAANLNQKVVVWTFICAVIVGGDAFATVLPAFGISMAAILVFLGTLNYVAYRDIFERRAGNRPLTEAVEARGLAEAHR